MKIKVFYNQSCKICNTEINQYKRICNDKISWVNIVDNKTAERLTSASYPDLIRRIHVLKDKRRLSAMITTKKQHAFVISKRKLSAFASTEKTEAATSMRYKPKEGVSAFISSKKIDRSSHKRSL